MSYQSKKHKVKEMFFTLSISFVFALSIKATSAEARFIASESMQPTLMVNDRLVIEKVTSHLTNPKRGEIVLFAPPYVELNKLTLLEKTKTFAGFSNLVPYIKRVIALPGETVEIKNGQVLINQNPLDESEYLKDRPLYEMPPLLVPENEIFVLGDNRNNSGDSHVWGTLPIDKIIGKAVFRVWPFERLGFLD